MFKIKVIKEIPFKVVVYGYSKINTLMTTVKDSTKLVVDRLISYIRENVKIIDTTKIIIEKVKLITNPRLTIDTKQFIIETHLSSKEKISGNVITGDIIIDNIIRSKEKIGANVIETLKIIADPRVGYFKKLYEFDNLTLAELDILTVEEMDYILMLMANNNEEVVM